MEQNSKHSILRVFFLVVYAWCASIAALLAQPWYSVGPSLGDGGHITAFTPSGDSGCYIGTLSGNLFKVGFADRYSPTLIYQNMFTPPHYSDVRITHVLSVSRDTLFFIQRNDDRRRLLFTVDGGVIWDSIDFGIYNPTTITTDNEGTVLLGMSTSRILQLKKGSDPRTGWEVIREGIPGRNGTLTSSIFAGYGTLYATIADGWGQGAYGTVIASSDRQTWRDLTGSPRVYQVLWSIIANSRGDLFVVGFDSWNGNQLLFRSTNDGASWSVVLQPTISPYHPVNLIASDANENLYVSHGFPRMLYRSGDNGNTWSATGVTGEAWHIVRDDQNRLWCVTGSGDLQDIWCSKDNGESWERVFKKQEWSSTESFIPPISKPILSLHCMPWMSFFIGFAGTAGAGLYRTMNGGISFEPVIKCPLKTVHAVAVSKEGRVFAGGAEGFYIGSRFGIEWNSTSLVAPDVIVTDVILGDSAIVVASTLGEGVLRSSDYGATWGRSNDGLPTNDCLWLTADSADRLFVGTRNSVWYSRDWGTTWLLFTEEISSAGGINDLVVDDTVLFAATDHGVYMSLDSGETWARSGVPDVKVYSLGLSHYAPQARIWAGTENGMWGTKDGGREWKDESYALPHAPVQIVHVVKAYPAHRVIIALEGNGMFVAKERDLLTSVEEYYKDGTVPAVQFLSGTNRSLLQIKLNLKRSGHVSLGIFNILGSEVGIILDERREEGEHALSWDTNTLPPGIYFYRLEYADNMETGKLLIR